MTDPLDELQGFAALLSAVGEITGSPWVDGVMTVRFLGE
jgi:hypothetical protein